jgi:hypothetical protein
MPDETWLFDFLPEIRNLYGVPLGVGPKRTFRLPVAVTTEMLQPLYLWGGPAGGLERILAGDVSMIPVETIDGLDRFRFGREASGQHLRTLLQALGWAGPEDEVLVEGAVKGYEVTEPETGERQPWEPDAVADARENLHTALMLTELGDSGVDDVVMAIERLIRAILTERTQQNGG